MPDLDPWPLIKVLAVFAAMLGGIRARLGLWPSILGGSLLMGLFFGLSLWGWLKAASSGLIAPQAVLLCCIVGLILLLSNILESSGNLERLMTAVRGRLRRPGLRLVFFPALIGLLPMPGGAVFSAPMLGRMAEPLGVSSTDRVVLNYWFRHMWELSWPLYPVVILTSSLSGIPLVKIVLLTLPGMVVYTLLGWWWFLRPLRIAAETPTSQEGTGNSRDLLRAAAPLITAILGSLGLELLLSAVLPGWPVELGIVAGLTLAIGVGLAQAGGGAGRLITAMRRPKFLNLLLVVAAVFVFKEVMGRSTVVAELSTSVGVEAALAVVAGPLPLLVGMIAGIAMAFAGATLPLLLGLAETQGMTAHLIPLVLINLFSGFIGLMISPLHICFILSCEFFGVDLPRVWRRLLPPCAMLAAFVAAYAVILW